MKDLPRFQRRRLDEARRYIARVLTNSHRVDHTQLYDLIEYEDGHFRALFSPEYFILAEGRTEPTRSQWSTLKKHMRRIDPKVFVFKEHGETEHQGRRAYYIDFGFFAE